MMCNEIEYLKVKYQDQAEILVSDMIVMHLFLVCTKLYKSKLVQANEAEVNSTDIMYKSHVSCMNVAWRIKSCKEKVMQVGEGEVVLTNMEFKGNCYTCGKYGHKQNKVPKKNKSEEKKETRNILASAITVVRWGIRLQTFGNMRLIKTRGSKIIRGKTTRRRSFKG